MNTRVCLNCRKQFIVTSAHSRTKQTCSKKCRYEYVSKSFSQKIIKKCLICKFHYKVVPRRKKSKFCSFKCYWESLKGKIPVSPFIKGSIPWNKGKVVPQLSGENAYQWKGDKVGYSALHKWVRKHRGDPRHCEHCKDDTKIGIKMYQWANISGEYKRDLTDWMRLCAKCHSKFDKMKRNNIQAV